MCDCFVITFPFFGDLIYVFFHFKKPFFVLHFMLLYIVKHPLFQFLNSQANAQYLSHSFKAVKALFLKTTNYTTTNTTTLKVVAISDSA